MGESRAFVHHPSQCGSNDRSSQEGTRTGETQEAGDVELATQKLTPNFIRIVIKFTKLVI